MQLSDFLYETGRAAIRGYEDELKRSRIFEDCLFLSLVVIFSFILYIKELGFYEADWVFLGKLRLTPNQSLSGLFHEINTERMHMRPISVLYWVVMYKSFGVHPLGYHLINCGVFLVCILLFYTALQHFVRRRVLCLAACVIYALMPNYSTTRFWVHGFSIHLSMALYFVSIHSDLKALNARTVGMWSWKLLSMASMAFSVLAYEVVLPLMLLNPVLVWYAGRQLMGKSFEGAESDKTITIGRLIRSDLRVLYGIIAVILLPVTIFKLMTTTRLGNPNNFVSQMIGIIEHLLVFPYREADWGLNLVHALVINCGYFGIGLPYVVWKILNDYFSPLILVAAVALGIIIFVHLYRADIQSQVGSFSKASPLRLVKGGMIAFILGYVIFLTNYNVQFTPTGMANRTAIAAAVGIALAVAGGIGWLALLYPTERSRRIFLSLPVAIVGAGGFLITNTVALFWIDSYRIQQEIVAELQQQFEALPPESIVMVDGFCPYNGPAIVFGPAWELKGALQALSDSPNRRIDIVTSDLELREDGIHIPLFGGYQYAYDKLFVYNYKTKMTQQLNDVESARNYFQAFSPSFTDPCPESHYGIGVPIF